MATELSLSGPGTEAGGGAGGPEDLQGSPGDGV